MGAGANARIIILPITLQDMAICPPRSSLANKSIHLSNRQRTGCSSSLWGQVFRAIINIWHMQGQCPSLVSEVFPSLQKAALPLRPPLECSFHLVIFQGSLGGHQKHLTSWCTSAVLHIYKLCGKINLSFVTTYVDLGSEVLVVLPLSYWLSFNAYCILWGFCLTS